MEVKEAIMNHLIENCNFDNTYFHIILGLAHFSPVIVTVVIYTITYYTQEIFHAVMSFWLTVDTLVNYIITDNIVSEAPVPQCGGDHAYPSFQTEHAFFLYTYMTLAYYYYPIKMNTRDVILLQIWVLLTWVSNVTLGYNNFNQAFFGSLLGSGIAVVAHTLTYILFFFERENILEMSVVKTMGYKDTIFYNGPENTVKIHKQDIQSLVNVIKNSYNSLDELWIKISNLAVQK
jgi:hypothetical protein